MKIHICLLFFSIIGLNSVIYSQNKSMTLKLHSTLGDTIDDKENDKFNLFKNVPEGQFKYAIYKSENNLINVHIFLKNGDSIIAPHSIEEFLKDSERVSCILASKSNIVSISDDKRDNLKLYIENNNRKRRIRKGSFVFLKLNSNYDSFKNHPFDKDVVTVRVKKINFGRTPTLSVRLVNNKIKNLEIKLDEIEAVKYYPKGLYALTLFTDLITVPLTVGCFIQSREQPEFLPFGITFGFYVSRHYIRGNPKFDLKTNSKFIIN